jgi:hypothetical protein
MSAFVMVLAAGMAVGSGPEMVSAETAAGLPSDGVWQGTWVKPNGEKFRVTLPGVVNPMPRVGTAQPLQGDRNRAFLLAFPYWITDEGAGRLRMWWVGTRDYHALYALYRWDADCLLISFDDHGRPPASFRAGENNHLVTLRRVKPGK